jgi:hemoglobin-like flavoprotein
MGGHPSSTRSLPSEKDDPNIPYPHYYVEDPISDEDLTLARQSWALIVEDRGQEYLANKEELKVYCITWFHTVFYNHLFEVEPDARSLFTRDLERQGRMLVKMISFALGSFHEGDSLRESLQKLAVAHAAYGVKPDQYNTMGDVLFWSLNRVLGSEFSPRTREAWTRIYCSMLRIVLPRAVQEDKRLKLMRQGTRDSKEDEKGI